MSIPTYLWTRRNGQKIPLQLIEDDYLKNIYRRLKEASFGNGNEVLSSPGRNGPGVEIDRKYKEDTPITQDVWELWIPRIEAEAERRNLRLPKIDRQTYHLDLSFRRLKRDTREKGFKTKFQ